MDAKQIAQATAGEWHGNIYGNEGFSAVTVLSNAAPGNLCITVDSTRKWQRAGVKPPSEEKIHAAAAKGAKAFVVGENFNFDVPYPILKVANTWDALSQISDMNRDSTIAKRILVTGSVGKTNYKLMMHHCFSPLTNIHAVLSSANLNVPIWCSLASIGNKDKLAVVEVSVANPNRGRTRSALIKPHICVLTNISSSHTAYHGSVENLIHAKAESVLSLEEGGIVLMSADHPYFNQLKDEVQRLRPVPVLTWGKQDFCDAQLLGADYELNASCWKVKAKVMGNRYDYQIGTHHSFAPISSLSILLSAAVTGVDVEGVAKQLASYIPGDTTGRLYDVPLEEGQFKLFDYSQRGSIEGFRAAISDLYRLAPRNRRIIMALGESRDLAEDDEKQVHEEIAELIQVDRTAKVFTVGGGMKILRSYLADSNILETHTDTPEELQEELLDTIKNNDIVFIQGHHRVWMSRIVKTIDRRWGLNLSLSPNLAGDSDEPEIESGDPDTISSFLAVGDVMMTRDFPGRLIEEGSDWVFGKLAADMQKADSCLANLECVISQRGDYISKLKEKRPFHYRAPQFVSEVFSKAGFTLLCTANNHSMDYGAEALTEQLNLLEQMGMPYVGSGRNLEESKRWHIQQCGATKVAVIGFDTTAPYSVADENTAGNFYLPGTLEAMVELQPLIQQARKQAHIVLLTMHWGDNWKETPKPATVELAHAIIDAGADAILGHSSHILQGIEIYQNKPIIYDMGSFLFDRVSQARMRDSAYFELKLSQKGIHEVMVSPVYLSRCRVRRSQNSRRRILDLMLGLSADLGTQLTERDGHLSIQLEMDESPRKIQNHSMEVGFSNPAQNKLKTLTEIDLSLFNSGNIQPQGRIINVGGGLEVAAFKHPKQVFPGYAFVFEIQFRCLIERSMRWRGEISFYDQEGNRTYLRYPIADGSWHNTRSGSEQWFADTTLVRTPRELGIGRYKLYWNIWSRDENKDVVYWIDKYAAERAIEKGIYVGEIEITKAVQKGVAGVDWDTELAYQEPLVKYSNH